MKRFNTKVLSFLSIATLLLWACALLAGCGEGEPKGVEGDGGQNRAAMIKWHQEHDKKPAAPAGS